MEWIEGLNRVLDYIEAHLQEDLPLPVVAAQARFSHFSVQRMFAAMTEMTLAEYIRQRRLSLAGQELQMTSVRVLDVALKYGYETPESFQKAFVRFHGITPSAARRVNARLRYLNPLRLQVNLIGGDMMDYTVEKMDRMLVMGMERRFRYDSAFGEIPAFWDEYCKRGFHEVVPGCLGMCVDDDESPDFAYLIANFCGEKDQAPEGFVKREIPEHTWVKFRAVGPIPGALQALNRQIFTQWLPGNPEYEMAEGINLEVYSMGDMHAQDYVSQIWIPVRKKDVTSAQG